MLPISDSGLCLGWLCRAGHYVAGLSPVCPIRFVMCVDDSPVHDALERQEGIRFFSLESRTGRRNEGRDGAANDILPSYRDEIEEALASGKRRVLAASITTRSLSAFAAETGCELIGNSPDLAEWLNDKSNFLAALDELGLPKMRGRWACLGEWRYGEISMELGSSFVAQLAHGTSGSGTVFIRSEAEYEAAGAQFGGGPVWLVPDLGELSLNVNALALGAGRRGGVPERSARRALDRECPPRNVLRERLLRHGGRVGCGDS
jgi:hypothetical protein